jgi:hypothetical protein
MVGGFFDKTARQRQSPQAGQCKPKGGNAMSGEDLYIDRNNGRPVSRQAVEQMVAEGEPEHRFVKAYLDERTQFYTVDLEVVVMTTREGEEMDEAALALYVKSLIETASNDYLVVHKARTHEVDRESFQRGHVGWERWGSEVNRGSEA